MPEGVIVWFTGHSKSGKTTLSKLLLDHLKESRQKAIRLDSDTLPKGIIKPEADSWEEKQRLKNENLTFLAKLLYENGYIVLISSVGRFARWRAQLRKEVPRYLEIYLKCPIDVRLQRDAEQKYESHAEYFHYYEEPHNPDLTIETNRYTLDQSIRLIAELLRARGFTTD